MKLFMYCFLNFPFVIDDDDDTLRWSYLFIYFFFLFSLLITLGGVIVTLISLGINPSTMTTRFHNDNVIIQFSRMYLMSMTTFKVVCDMHSEINRTLSILQFDRDVSSTSVDQSWCGIDKFNPVDILLH